MFPWLAVFLFGAEVSVCVGLSAVKDLLEPFVSRLLSFHSHLMTKTEINPSILPIDGLTAATQIPPRLWFLSPSASPLCLSPWSLWCPPTPPSPSRLTWPNQVQRMNWKSSAFALLWKAWKTIQLPFSRPARVMELCTIGESFEM